MKVEATMKYLGVEEGTTKAGKPYFVMGLLQGFDSERIYTDEQMANKVKGYPLYSEVRCLLRISIGQEKTFVNIDDIELVKQGGK